MSIQPLPPLAPNWHLDNEELDSAVLGSLGLSSGGFTVDVLSADGYEFTPSSRLSTVYRHGGLFVVTLDEETDVQQHSPSGVKKNAETEEAHAKHEVHEEAKREDQEVVSVSEAAKHDVREEEEEEEEEAKQHPQEVAREAEVREEAEAKEVVCKEEAAKVRHADQEAEISALRREVTSLRAQVRELQLRTTT
jgi:hypothetical protein